MATPSNAYQFYNTSYNGLNLVTRGLAYEWNSTTLEYTTGIGLETFGLVYGLGDFWHYADSPATITWTLVE